MRRSDTEIVRRQLLGDGDKLCSLVGSADPSAYVKLPRLSLRLWGGPEGAGGDPHGGRGGGRPLRPPICMAYTQLWLFCVLFFATVKRFCTLAQPKRRRHANFDPSKCSSKTVSSLAPCSLQLATCTLAACRPAACTSACSPAALQPSCNLACTSAASGCSLHLSMQPCNLAAGLAA